MSLCDIVSKQKNLIIYGIPEDKTLKKQKQQNEKYLKLINEVPVVKSDSFLRLDKFHSGKWRPIKVF